MTNLDSILKTRDITWWTKVYIVKAKVFSVVTYRFENWTIKKAKRQMLSKYGMEKTLETPLDSKEIKVVSPKGNQPWIFIWRTDADTSILWSPDGKSQLIGKDLMGKIEGKRRVWQRMRRMDGIFNKLWKIMKGREACCSSWGCKE